VVSLYNLKPERVIKAFERAGWVNKGFRRSHVKLTKEGKPNILSIPVHINGLGDPEIADPDTEINSG
jgi:predicted RNA binding protein YcfA (HicA-like mRNA interferase family)